MRHIERENLDVIFLKTAPESILNRIREHNHASVHTFLSADARIYPFAVYDHFGLLNFQEYSLDETRLRHDALKENVDKEGNMVFSLLYQYAEKILLMNGREPVCKLDRILGWNSISSRLGQDIFTTAWLAKRQCASGSEGAGNLRFDWPAIIGTDDKKLDLMMEKGLAENHFHLNGSTQSFPLSWASLMNHPNAIHYFFAANDNFKKELAVNVSRGAQVQVMDLARKVLYAAMIRSLLFMRCMGEIESGQLRQEFFDFDAFPFAASVKNKTEYLRMAYGSRFEQIDGGRKCLDYAISRKLYDVNLNSYNRLLGGERCFLYHCFWMQFMHRFTLLESSLFYLYLLIKSNFRSELIQGNKRVGFKNFSEYQDRKNQFFEGMDEYWTEAQRLAFCTATEENHIVSLEARIMTKSSPAEIAKEIRDYDERIKFSAKEKDMVNTLFYVAHFPKKRFSKKEFKNEMCLVPRNAPTRKKIKLMALSQADFRKKYHKLNTRIHGIDACSNEIGCRPETFATEFRYLRAAGNPISLPWWHAEEEKVFLPPVCVTFHAGEDFLGICDGLRAIDEAVTFLEFQKGDRLGHAMALGINPEDYYNFKRRNIVMTKQDYLDDCIWLLFRSLEWNISMETNLREKLKESARNLISDIFQLETRNLSKLRDNIGEYGDILELYYYSWMLRGDAPELYRSGQYLLESTKQAHSERNGLDNLYMLKEDSYQNYMLAKNNREKLEKYRKNTFISYLYYLYHYDITVKTNGLETYSYSVDDQYIHLIRQFQTYMRKDIAKRGISVECNPTSNILIGTFRYYEKHPILTFNNHYLEDDCDNAQIKVSINTDDLGVFDTSLRNEYALLLSSICRKRHREGNYNDEAVYEYLNYIRENGIEMAF